MYSIPSDYHSYLLRLWRTQADGRPAWRASLESPQTGTRQGFVSLQELFVYLAQECNGEAAWWAGEWPCPPRRDDNDAA